MINQSISLLTPERCASQPHVASAQLSLRSQHGAAADLPGPHRPAPVSSGPARRETAFPQYPTPSAQDPPDRTQQGPSTSARPRDVLQSSDARGCVKGPSQRPRRDPAPPPRQVSRPLSWGSRGRPCSGFPGAGPDLHPAGRLWWGWGPAGREGEWPAPNQRERGVAELGAGQGGAGSRGGPGAGDGPGGRGACPGGRHGLRPGAGPRAGRTPAVLRAQRARWRAGLAESGCPAGPAGGMGRVQLFEICLSHGRSVYSPGEPLAGAVRVRLGAPLPFRGGRRVPSGRAG